MREFEDGVLGRELSATSKGALAARAESAETARRGDPICERITLETKSLLVPVLDVPH